MMIEPEIEALPWAEQAQADDAAYRRQLGYLFERSRFYREKLSLPRSDYKSRLVDRSGAE